MASVDTSLAPALDRLRRGDLEGARAAAEAALADDPDRQTLLEFAGFVAARMGQPEAAIPHFRRWLDLSPDNRTARFNLATALVGAGRLEEAAQVCTALEGDPRLLRLAGYAYQQLGSLDEATAAYQAAVAANPSDHESWNNLGNVYTSQGEMSRAIEAFTAAIRLRPDIVPVYFNFSEVLAQADRPEARQALLRQAVTWAPQDPEMHTELGRAECAVPDFAAGERAFREAIRLSPTSISAYVELGVLLENMNRLDELDQLIADADANGVEAAELNFLKAVAGRRRGRFEEALDLAEATPSTINSIRRAQLIAELNDRLGNTEAAFEAYREMNSASLARPVLAGPTYREMVTANARLLTPERISAWTGGPVDREFPAPVFLVGFPRSGTTLLDTLLMNMPQLHVLEEQPVLFEVENALGSHDRLAGLTGDEANALRRLYFAALDKIQPPRPGTTAVDKFPLHMTQMPLIHRIFPDTKVIFVERHPCDAVLSCFMSNFQLNLAMRSFTDLEEAARTYDAVFDAWTRAAALLPLNVHRIRYERMVEDLEGEMRPLLDFLGLPWDPNVLDNRASAARREHIRTASYSQVTEPIYRRAAGRWQRYRAQLEPVLPILAPWVERMGYTV